MNYELLKNKIYLTLLVYYNQKDMPSFVQLGKDVGVSRQTASSKFKELMAQNLIELSDDDVVLVKNPLNIDVDILKCYLDTHNNIDLVELKEVLFGVSIDKNTLIKELNIARSSLYLDKTKVVYGIVSEGKIKYIGTTEHLKDRIQQHIKKRPFLTPTNFIILKDEVGKNNFNIELELIHLLQPEWNKMGVN